MSSESHSLVKRFRPAGFFLLRTPVLPLNDIQKYTEGTSARFAIKNTSNLERALNNDRVLLRQRLRTVLERPLVKEALWLASPSLYRQIPRWIGEPNTVIGRKIERSLLRYFTRMASRPVPFGLFAGCSVGTVGSETSLKLAPQRSYRRNTRIDICVLSRVIQEITENPATAHGVKYVPNPLLRRFGERTTVATIPSKETNSSRYIVIKDTRPLSVILERASEGLCLDEFANELVRSGMTFKQAYNFLDQVIGAQVLLPDLVPYVTGPEPAKGLVSELSRRQLAPEKTTTLKTICEKLSNLDCIECAVDPSAYEEISMAVRTLTDTEPQVFLHSELHKPMQCGTIGPEVIDAVSRGIEALVFLVKS